MKTIRYRFHLLTLVVAGVVFWLAKDFDPLARLFNFGFFHYGLMGALHATSVVVSLRDRKKIRLLAAFGFIILVTLWAAFTPIMSLWGSVVWYPITAFLRPRPDSGILIFITGSVIGSLGYWFLVRWFWMRWLQRSDLLRTVAFCVAATLLVGIAEMIAPTGKNLVRPELRANLLTPDLRGEILELLLTFGWWFAFSLSLYWSETIKAVSRKNIGFVIVTVVFAFGLTVGLLYFVSRPTKREIEILPDTARLSDLKSIIGTLHVDWEYAQDKKLEWKPPATEKGIARVFQGDHLRLADPITGVPYGYMPLTGSSYQLCAVFDHDSSDQDILFIGKVWAFPKGRHCFAVDGSGDAPQR